MIHDSLSCSTIQVGDVGKQRDELIVNLLRFHPIEQLNRSIQAIELTRTFIR